MTPDEAKILGMVSLGVGSFIAGMLPAWFSRLGRQQWPLFLSTLLCFGGGVLLATAFLHMLPEARETLPDYAELALCGGFFLVYLTDELVHSCYPGNHENNILNSTSSYSQQVAHNHNHSHSYGAIESSGLLDPMNDHDHHHDARGSEECHVNHTEPCNSSAAGRAGLLLALLLHSLLEGLAIGLQNVTSKVLLLVGAVASHKLVVGFCLGVEIAASNKSNICAHILYILIFSLGSVFGIGAGMGLEVSHQIWTETTLGVLQSLAAGTLVYVAVSEVLPRERAKWHRTPGLAGLKQFLATTTGFVLIFLVNKYLDAEHTGPV